MIDFIQFHDGEMEIAIWLIRMRNQIAQIHLVEIALNVFRMPITKKQQNRQFQIIKKLIKYQSAKNYLYTYFRRVIESSNIPLVDFIIKELSVDINELFSGLTVLQLVVEYLVNYKNKNYDLGYEMFDYFLTIGADVNKNNSDGYDINYYINQIKDQNIQQTLFDKLLKFRSNTN